jgi:Cu-processing system permease protein
MKGTLTIAHLTLAEARRRRIMIAGLLCALAFLAVFAAALFFAARDMNSNARMSLVDRQAWLTTMTLVSFFAANFLAVVFAVLLPVDTLSGEIDSGVIQTLASKPIGRAEIVLGKWIAHWLMAIAYLTVLTGGILVSVRVITGFAPYSPARALALMGLEITLMMTVSIAGGARLSTVANGVTALGFYSVAFVGGFVEQIGALAGIESARMIGVAASLISPPDAMWRLAAYHLQTPIMRHLAGLLFSAASVPTQLMVWWAAAFTLLALLYAVASFNRRAL